MNIQIVVISGKQGAGKTTLADNLVRCVHRHRGWRAETMNFADTIYEIHNYARNRMKENGLPVPKGLEAKDGPLLQFLGTEWGRKTYGENVWADALKGRIKAFVERMGSAHENYVFIIGDCRFRNELASLPDALKVRLECNREVRRSRCSQWRDNENHPSEIDLDGSLKEFDFTYDSELIDANGLAELVYHQLVKRR